MASPWAFGSVDPTPRFLLVAVALGACALALSLSAARKQLDLPDVPLWPLLALLALGLLQLVPLPAPLLRLVAPGPARVWYPSVEEVGGVLGDRPRPLSISPEATWQGLLWAAGLVGLALLAAPALTRERTAVRTAYVVALSGSALAVFGIVARTRFGSRLYGTIAVPTVAPFGPFVSKNHFAGYVVMAALLSLGLCVSLAASTRHEEWTRGRGALGVVPLSLLVVLTAALPSEARARMATAEGASFRLDTWRDSLRLWTSSPMLGQGFCAFADAFARVKLGHGTIRVEHAENDYVEVLAEGGLVGLGLALLAFLLPARRIAASLPHRESLRRGLAVGALSGLVALGAHSALDFNLRIPSNATLAALLSAFAAAGAGKRPASVGRVPLVALALMFALAFASVVGRGPTAFDRSASWRQARDEAREASSSPSPDVRALRALRAKARLAQVLAVRPAFAEGWLLMAALSRERGDLTGGRAQSAHAQSLDPSRADLQAAARALQEP